MYNINSVMCDAIWFGKLGIVKARDQYDGTKRYVGVGEGENETIDISYILAFGQKYGEKEIGSLIDWFKPYTNFKHTKYQAESEKELSSCCQMPMKNGLCLGCKEHG